jgi:hypothetical protein
MVGDPKGDLTVSRNSEPSEAAGPECRGGINAVVSGSAVELLCEECGAVLGRLDQFQQLLGFDPLEWGFSVESAAHPRCCPFE